MTSYDALARLHHHELDLALLGAEHGRGGCPGEARRAADRVADGAGLVVQAELVVQPVAPVLDVERVLARLERGAAELEAREDRGVPAVVRLHVEGEPRDHRVGDRIRLEEVLPALGARERAGLVAPRLRLARDEDGRRHLVLRLDEPGGHQAAGRAEHEEERDQPLVTVERGEIARDLRTARGRLAAHVGRGGVRLQVGARVVALDGAVPGGGRSEIGRHWMTIAERSGPRRRSAERAGTPDLDDEQDGAKRSEVSAARCRRDFSIGVVAPIHNCGADCPVNSPVAQLGQQPVTAPPQFS
jgi:hypothetical protein